MTDLKAYYRNSVRQRITSIEALAEGLARRDPESLEAVRRIAHTLKGTGASYGFPRVTDSALAVMRAADGGVAEAAAELLEVLRCVASGKDGGSD